MSTHHTITLLLPPLHQPITVIAIIPMMMIRPMMMVGVDVLMLRHIALEPLFGVHWGYGS